MFSSLANMRWALWWALRWALWWALGGHWVGTVDSLGTEHIALAGSQVAAQHWVLGAHKVGITGAKRPLDGADALLSKNLVPATFLLNACGDLSQSCATTSAKLSHRATPQVFFQPALHHVFCN